MAFDQMNPDTANRASGQHGRHRPHSRGAARRRAAEPLDGRVLPEVLRRPSLGATMNP